MKLDDPGCENALVRLEPFDETHLAQITASGAADAMWSWMQDIPRGKSLEAYVAYACELQARGELYAFSAFLQRDGRFAGIAAFDAISNIHRRLRITAFWVPHPLRRRGIFSAIQCAMIRRALDWRARRIEWLVPAAAEDVIGVLEKLGAKREGVFRAYLRLADGSWPDMVQLAMLRDEAELAVQTIEDRLSQLAEEV
ncbi:hypothetical protein AY600_07720 [Phormidium willei BDU 130791]|nr:hypothetical protein AY600_07720 [Phormidium willei BDU 130791]